MKLFNLLFFSSDASFYCMTLSNASLVSYITAATLAYFDSHAAANIWFLHAIYWETCAQGGFDFAWFASNIYLSAFLRSLIYCLVPNNNNCPFEFAVLFAFSMLRGKGMPFVASRAGKTLFSCFLKNNGCQEPMPNTASMRFVKKHEYI